MEPLDHDPDASVLNASRRASTCSDLGVGNDDEDHIRVICRVRPPNAREGRSALGLRTCLSVDDDAKTVSLKAGSGPKLFTFDHSVGPEGTQETLFQLAGKPATRACMQGYNGTVFCYGQTGSGKTFTMFGPNVDACDSGDELRGLVPRVLEYLFAHVAREEKRNGGRVKYLCRCSFYEIFNERVFDLLSLDAGCSLGGLQTREDMKKGVYVEGLTEEAVDSPHQAYQVLTRGYRNRHVGETAMNRESSRSHAVFTVVLESREVDTVDGITRARCASFNLVDLAGSERQSMTGATGERLKEASSINKSLSALGNVINALVSGKTRYVPYRDSRLTFLLRDSLGGNAKTFLVACTSPDDANFAETLSTLKFAQRAKMIKNKAVVNENTSGTVEALQKQVRQLRQELLAARAVITASGGAGPARPLGPAGDGDGQEAGEGAAAVAASTGPLAARLRETEALLRDALARSLRLEQSRDLTERMAAKAQAMMDRQEQALLNERMVRKMKESQVQRLLKKGGSAGTATTTEEELRTEIEVLRKELDQVPLESIKWRAAAENAQAQLDALLDEKGLGMWVEAREQSFASALEERLKVALEDKASLEERLAELGQPGSGDAAAARAARRLSDGGMNRLREAESKGAALEEELATARRAAEASEAQLAEARAQAAQAVSTQSQLTVKLTLAERRLEALEGENKVLKADRDLGMKLMQDRLETLQAQHQEHATAARQDVEEQLAAACKDNAILLQRLKETAEEADEAAARHQETKAKAQGLAEELAALRPQLEGAEAALAESKAAIEEQKRVLQAKEEAFAEQLAELRREMQAAEARHEEEAAELRSSLDEALGRAQQLGAEKEEAAFQLTNLREDHDTLRELMEFTQGKNADLEKALAEANASAEQLDKARAKAEAALEDAQAQVSDLENRLDKAGGDAAEDRRVMRDLEAANQELSQERAQLLETVEGLKAELAAATELHDKASKEAARQAQVLSDLGEQVGRLQGELAEARAKEQQARTEADALGQEREDLLQRATEAEESQAEMGEEMMSYLDEITALKTRLAMGEQSHAERLRALETEHAQALGAAQQAAAERAQAVERLEGEVATLRERLQQREEAQEARALMDLEESRAQAKEAERRLQEAEWAHTQAVAQLQQQVAEAEARGAEAARYKAALGASQAEGEGLRGQLQEAQHSLGAARTQLAAADDRCESLAKQVGEALQAQREWEGWQEEKVRWEAEVARAREMEKEAYDRYETAEQLRAKTAKDLEAAEQQLEELKAVNVKLVGHANSRQKIQLHRKLKEELMDMARKCKVLEEENYALRLQAQGGKASSSASSSTAAAQAAGAGPVLANVTNTAPPRRVTRAGDKLMKQQQQQHQAAAGEEEEGERPAEEGGEETTVV